ncbi:MAG: hypothetical protein ABIU97_08640 [Dehalococcoidia bacterium]
MLTKPASQPGLKPLIGVDPAGFICRCGRPMFWLEGHAVCAGCETFLPACKCS